MSYEKNLFYVKRIQKLFLILYFIFSIDEEKVQKKYSANLDEKY